MRLLAIDDERPALYRLVLAVQEALPDAELKDFMRVDQALECIREGYLPDVVFTDIEMPGMTGLELAGEIRRLSPQSKLVFVTGFSHYAVEAFAVRASDYLMKPVTAEKIRKTIDALEDLAPLQSERKRLRAKCFGNFEIFLDDEPMAFRYTKTKELLAYLIHRQGAMSTNGECMAILWEDNADQGKIHYFRRVREDLIAAFTEAGLEEALSRQRGSLAIVPGEFECDYYHFLAGTAGPDETYGGEYMAQYSWAEDRVAFLDEWLARL